MMRKRIQFHGGNPRDDDAEAPDMYAPDKAMARSPRTWRLWRRWNRILMTALFMNLTN